MGTAYHVAYGEGELPPTRTYPRPGQRTFMWLAPGALKANGEGEVVETCLLDVNITQRRGSKADDESYHLIEMVGGDPSLDVRNLPRDQYGRPAAAGFVFVNYSTDPTPDRPGVYRVACNRAGLPYWCECLGSKGHHQTSDCKHKCFLRVLATTPADADRPTQPQETASDRADRQAA